MQYTMLGKTGFKVSRLGFGAMRLPMVGNCVDRDKAIPMIHQAFESGVNYIDSAVGYCGGDSQRVIGEALKGWRDKVVVSTKNHYYNKLDDRPWWRNLEDSLKYLDVETIDIYNFHGLKWQRYLDQVRGKDGQMAWMRKALDQGLIRHICFSFHDTAEALEKLAATGEFDVVTLQYNLLDRSNEPALAACRKAGMGVIVMGPVGGGRLGTPSDALRKMLPGARTVPEVALRFVLANPNVTIALSGMSEMKHVEENIRVAARTSPLSATEKRRVKAALNRFGKLADLYCTGCSYCMPCPSGVDIPGNFTALNYNRVYDLPDVASKRYGSLRAKATQCIACGKCMDKCPQNINIISQLRETVRTLDDSYGKLVVNITPTEVASLKRTNGRFNATLKCSVECHNVSDIDVAPQLDFSPAKNIAVSRSRRTGGLTPFKRGKSTLTVEATSWRDGEPLRLNPSAERANDVVFVGDPLPVAIAPQAAKKSPEAALKKAPLVRAESVTGGGVPSAEALAAHALAARFAHNAEALIVELTIRNPFKRPPTSRRAVRDSDRVWFRLDLAAGRRIRVAKGSPTSFDIAFGFPAKGSEPVIVEVFRLRLDAEKKQMIRADVVRRGDRRRLLVRIPWKLLGAKAPEAGASLGAAFGMTTHGRAGGHVTWQLHWGHANGAKLLLI